MDTLATIALIDKVLQHGAPAVEKIVRAWGIENPTVEDIQSMEITETPDSFFEE